MMNVKSLLSPFTSSSRSATSARLRWLVGTVGIALLFTTTQCKSTYAKYCENQQACSGGNDADLDACIEGRRTKEDVADAYDCGDAFDNVTKCLETAVCKEKNLDTSGCSEQQKALSACEDAASGRRGSSSVSSSSSSSSSSSGNTSSSGNASSSGSATVDSGGGGG